MKAGKKLTTPSDKGNVAKVRSHVEVGLIRHAPGTISLIRESSRPRDGAEEVHAPPGALAPALVHVEEAKGDLDVRDPCARVMVARGVGDDAVGGQLGDVGAGEGGTGRSDLGGVVDEGLEGDVVGGHLELEIGLRVVGAIVLEPDNQLLGHFCVFLGERLTMKASITS